MADDDLAELKSKLHHQELMFERLIADISSLRNELQQSQKNYTELYNFSSSAYFTIDGDYTIQTVNHQAACLLGMDRQQLSHRIFTSFIAAHSQVAFVNNIKALHDTQCKQSSDLELLQKGGSKRTVILESMLLKGGMIRLCLFDVTNHRLDMKQNLQLEQAFNLIHHLFQNSSDPIAALDGQLYVTALNRAFCEKFSTIFATKIDIGMSLASVLKDFPDLKKKILNACAEALLGKKTYVIIENHRNKDEIYYYLPMQLTDVTTICSIHRHEYLPRKFGRTDGSFSNRRSLFRVSEPDTLA